MKVLWKSMIIFVYSPCLKSNSLNVDGLTFRVRELTTAKIGTLLKITGQVVRTHPVHPELVSGTFMCLDCRTIIKDVEQQFKYTQVLNIGRYKFKQVIAGLVK